MNAISLGEASELLLERVAKIEETETVSLWEANGRVLAEDIRAVRDQPPFPRSPLDGYAVKSSDLKGADREHPATLTVIEEVTAGHVGNRQVTSGTAVRIMTGAPIPEGADCIAGQEDTDYGEDVVNIYVELAPDANYCHQGEDYQAGTLILKKDTVLGAVEVGVLASLGMIRIPVYRKARVALITTGDEIVLPEEELLPGKIYDSNLYTLGSLLDEWGIEVTCRKRVADQEKDVAEIIEKEIACADMIVTTGGVSVGKKDIMHDVQKLLDCERIFWRVAIKPGMPTLCAQYKGKLLICLSGNPYGAAVNLEILVRPLLAVMTGREALKLKRKQALLLNAFPKRSRVTRYVRAFYEDGAVRIAAGSNDSGILSSMCGCNCLVEIPAGTDRVDEGEMVWIVGL